VSVSTNSARVQEISLNPQKLAGQCGKLKCCLNYELVSYVDAKKDFPRSNVPLETKDATYFYLKTDIFKRTMWFSSDPNAAVNLTPITVDRVKEIMEMNKKGEKPLKLDETVIPASLKPIGGYSNTDVEDSLTRFDEKKSNAPRKKKSKRRKGNA
jgi:cell fate regulator YaaT (PSP1 superfamily)